MESRIRANLSDVRAVHATLRSLADEDVRQVGSDSRLHELTGPKLHEEVEEDADAEHGTETEASRAEVAETGDVTKADRHERNEHGQEGRHDEEGKEGQHGEEGEEEEEEEEGGIHFLPIDTE